MLALEALGVHAETTRPIAVIEDDRPRAPIVASSAGARAEGIHPGMSTGAAAARLAGLDLRTREPARETALLHELATWGQRFTSFTSLEPPAALLLEIGGSLKLFGGARIVRERLQAELAAQGYCANLALAPTPRAALWLSRAGSQSVLDARATGARLGALPLTALDLPERAERNFARLGVSTVREAFRLPRDGLARRFGPALLRDWDRALGRLPEARRGFRETPAFTARRELPVALTETGRLMPFLDAMLAALADTLRRHDAGIDSLTLAFEHSRGAATTVRLRLLAVGRDPVHFKRLVGTRLESLHLPASVIAIRLESSPFKIIGAATSELLATRTNTTTEWSELIETLRARLGREAVRGVAPRDDPRPEQGWIAVEPGAAADVSDVPRRRPVWLLEAPRLLHKKNETPLYRGRPLALVEGTERIEAGWWDEQAVRRDYFTACTRDGARLWVYRDACARWFLQGYFA
jgi:protein ImuB